MPWRTQHNAELAAPREAEPTAGDPDVIPLHGRHALPAAPLEADQPITRRPSMPAIPLADRPWRLLIVPPTPGAPTRALNVRRWQAKLAVFAIGLLLTLAVADVVGIVMTLRSQDPIPTPDEVAALREGLLAVEDSISLAKAVRVAQEEYERDSLAALAVAGPNGGASLLAARRRVLDARRRAASRANVAQSYQNTPSSVLEGLPVIGRIVSGFSASRRHPLLHIIRPHLGVDVAAPYGTRITTSAAGRVTFVGYRFGYGLVVELDHGDGIATRYAHCSAVMVRKGQAVIRSALIATVGSSGLTTGPHLHYELTVNGRNVDPLKFRFPRVATDAAASATAPGVAPDVIPTPEPQLP